MGKELKIRKVSGKDLIGCAFLLISLIMLRNSIRLCFSGDIWYDELFTMGMAEHSYGELIGFTARDVHPPLYYFIVKAFLDLCKLIFPSADSVIVVKLVSVLPYFLFFIYAVTFLEKKFGVFVSGIFMFCIMSMPQMSAYTVEMRMYGWALFFVTAAFFHAYGLVCGVNYNGADATQGGGVEIVKNYVAVALYALAAAYTQYFACVAVIMVYLYLLVWFVLRYRKTRDKAALRALKGWTGCVVFSVIAYLPWLFVLISQIRAVSANYWILPLTWRSLGGCVKFLMKPAFQREALNMILAVILFLVYIALLIAYGLSVWSKGHKVAYDADYTEKESYDKENATFFYALAGCLVLCGLVASGFIASIIIRPVFVYRYMLPALGCFWLCFALCLDYNITHGGSCLKNDLLGKLLFQLASPYVYIILIILAVGIRDYQAFMGEEEYKARLMQETEEALSSIENRDIILYNFDQLQAVCGYYMPQENYLWDNEPEQLISEMFGNKGSIEDTGRIKEWLEEGRTIWFFGSFNSREDVRKVWQDAGIHSEETGSYMLERYWFNIYRIF